ncbi:DUF1564 domain-containing protein [Leptospira yasudae]|uniref:DUF1564 domain-containing protein n=1 Tax=Leptospira yasudae TaxID=2202201 RepID=A0ABX9M693_9LEPT|nr:DUF1564 domain-containing protein [Leptospira yasudae]RHX81330.1 DUF1564 domain-containing protein [Leptospira yasudae]RHX96128.1 DUF1564 domain-containing protein [Leptospira yasudae]
MGILSFNSDSILRSRLQENYTEVVTLLVSKEILLRYSEKERKVLAKRIPILLKTYGKYLTAIQRLGNGAGKTLYQSSPGRGNMVRMNVRLSTGSWALLGTLAQAHGVSRCFLFRYLLLLDEVGVGDSIVRTMNEGGPTFHRNYRYILHLDLLNNSITRTLACDPAHTFYVLDPRDWFDV